MEHDRVRIGSRVIARGQWPQNKVACVVHHKIIAAALGVIMPVHDRCPGDGVVEIALLVRDLVKRKGRRNDVRIVG